VKVYFPYPTTSFRCSTHSGFIRVVMLPRSWSPFTRPWAADGKKKVDLVAISLRIKLQCLAKDINDV